MRTTEESVVASASGAEAGDEDATFVSRRGGGTVFLTGALFTGEGGRVFSVSATAAICAVSGVVVAIVSVDGEGTGRERFAFIRTKSATATIPSAPTLARNERAAGDIEMNIRFSGSFRKKEIQCMLSSNAGVV